MEKKPTDSTAEHKVLSVAEAAGAMGVTSAVAIESINEEIQRLQSRGHQVDVAEHTRRILKRVQ